MHYRYVEEQINEYYTGNQTESKYAHMGSNRVQDNNLNIGDRSNYFTVGGANL